MIEIIGEKSIASVVEFGRFGRFSANSMAAIFKTCFHPKSYPLVFNQMNIIGVKSVPVVMATGAFVGMILAIQAFGQLASMGLEERLGVLINIAVVKELGPVLAAVMLAGRVGGALTAELGTMNVNDQILATRTLGVDPLEFLVVPRMLACFIVLPILAVIAEVVGIFGGYVIGVFEAHIPSPYYINQTIRAITFVDFYSGFTKVFFFAIIIGWTCCYHGFVTKGGSLGVGNYTTKAVAYSYIFIILSNTVLTKLILTFWG